MPKKMYRKYRKLEINKSPREGYCHMILDGVKCDKKIRYRGVCNACHKRIKSHDEQEMWFLPPQNMPWNKIKKNKNPRNGLCYMIIDGIKCPRPLHIRGVCKRCYGVLRKRGLEHKFLKKRAILRNGEYTLNKKASAYECRVIVNGKICRKKSFIRGLCNKHYGNLRRYAIFDKLALPAYKNGKRPTGKRGQRRPPG